MGCPSCGGWHCHGHSPHIPSQHQCEQFCGGSPRLAPHLDWHPASGLEPVQTRGIQFSSLKQSVPEAHGGCVDAVGSLLCAPVFLRMPQVWCHPGSTRCDNPGKGCQPHAGRCLYPQQSSSTSPTVSLEVLGNDVRAWLNTGVRLTPDQIGESPDRKSVV